MQERYLTNARLDKYKTTLDLSTDEFLGHKTSKSKQVLDLQKLSVFYNVVCTALFKGRFEMKYSGSFFFFFVMAETTNTLYEIAFLLTEMVRNLISLNNST